MLLMRTIRRKLLINTEAFVLYALIECAARTIRKENKPLKIPFMLERMCVGFFPDLETLSNKSVLLRHLFQVLLSFIVIVVRA